MSSTITANINIPNEEIERFCEQYHIEKLAFFGSVLRDDFTPKSDIDILVEFHPEHIPGLIRLSLMENELSRLFQCSNNRVDISAKV